ncbi:tyrosine-protein phosphatase [Candidatus Solirubrobacter pratensis]|uniref:tyrosine-protein phosphatase n=1 Tax=Candidatus Solirubrobacter pratensis TaxID=1298857 RepID=UPI000683DE17|nr:CpsB/CapC family capsule biosynthesis tyrosine phosphatase [Candidatus Solirubrobacter pratensis]
MIDLHCHALPGVDDGPAQQAGALALLRAAAAGGTRTVVATPHVSPRYRTSPETIDAGVAGMRAALAAERVELELLGGAEVAMELALELPDAVLRQLTLGDSSCLLLESPLAPAVGPVFERCVAELQQRGYRILLAHPERAPAFLSRPQRLQALVEGGALCSITASSLDGRFGAAARWYALELLRDGLVHSVDSDAHDAIGRPPGLTAGLTAAAETLPPLRERAAWLTTGAPAALLADAPLPG